MLPTLRNALGLALLASALAIARPAEAQAASPSAEAFDAAFTRALREGMGTIPAEGEAAAAALAAALPPDDALRQRRFEAMTCSAVQRDRAAALANAEARLAAEQALARPDPTSLALLLACRAALLPPASASRRVIADYDAALEAAQASGNALLLGQTYSLRAGGHSMNGDFAKALLDALEAQRMLDASGERFPMAANAQAVGIAYRRMGEQARAEEYLLRSLADPEIQSRWAYQIINLLQLGFLYDETGRYDDARRVLRDVIELCKANASPADCGYARLALAGVEVNDGAPRRALSLLTQAQADFETAGDPGDPTMVAFVRGQAFARLGRDAEALALLDHAVSTWTTEDNNRYLAYVLPERARVLERLGRESEAIADLRRFIEAHANDDRLRAEQRTDFMREQFDASQRELENAELKAREALRLQEIEGLNAARRWQWTAMALGAVLLVVLAVVVVRQVAKAQRLRLLALTDPLTGLANRRQTDYRGTVAFKAARASGQPFCVLAIDIDHFKQVNDTHGHAVGDAVLQRVGRECQRTLRKLDLMGRIGGEEFTGLLPETAEPAARLVAERLRAGVEGLDLDDVAPGLRVTISLGVAQMRGEDSDFAGLLARADAAMYRAKQSGRNRVVSDETPRLDP
jgi:diguanylate cyclase (GGDEF)-like protein